MQSPRGKVLHARPLLYKAEICHHLREALTSCSGRGDLLCERRLRLDLAGSRLPANCTGYTMSRHFRRQHPTCGKTFSVKKVPTGSCLPPVESCTTA